MKKIFVGVATIAIIGSFFISSLEKKVTDYGSKNTIEHNDKDFGSNGWHKYRIRNAK